MNDFYLPSLLSMTSLFVKHSFMDLLSDVETHTVDKSFSFTKKIKCYKMVF